MVCFEKVPSLLGLFDYGKKGIGINQSRSLDHFSQQDHIIINFKTGKIN